MIININFKGDIRKDDEEKMIMFIGVIGFGKSILVDGIVNYVIGVSFDDLFRFIFLYFEKEENCFGN